MSTKKMLKVTLVLMFIFSIAGCGSDGDSETNGDLTTPTVVVSVNAGVVTMTATALLTPVRTGSEISFTTLLLNAGGGALPTDAGCSDKKRTDLTGAASISCNFPQPTVAATLQVSATSGGLSETAPSIPIAGFVAQ